MPRIKTLLVWMALAIIIAVPLIGAMNSPLLAWRQPIYIIAGFAGIIAMCLLLVQPLLIAGHLFPIKGPTARRIHQAIGAMLALSLLAHVIGLWITSPPDVVDALLFRSPTQFSAWGVIAMWAVFAATILAARHRIKRWPPSLWRKTHIPLVSTAVIGSVIHALLIDGTMETWSKIALCFSVLAATVTVIAKLWLKSLRR